MHDCLQVTPGDYDGSRGFVEIDLDGSEKPQGHSLIDGSGQA